MYCSSQDLLHELGKVGRTVEMQQQKIKELEDAAEVGKDPIPSLKSVLFMLNLYLVYFFNLLRQ